MRPTLNPIDLLPAVLRVRSLSDREIILPWPEVERGVMILTASNVAVTGWEAWVKYPDGRIGRALDESALEMAPATIAHDETWRAFVQRTQRDVLRTIEAENGRWALAPDLEGGVPHFRLFTPGDTPDRD
jgi:hypothetical protein